MDEVKRTNKMLKRTFSSWNKNKVCNENKG